MGHITKVLINTPHALIFVKERVIVCTDGIGQTSMVSQEIYVYTAVPPLRENLEILNRDMLACTARLVQAYEISEILPVLKKRMVTECIHREYFLHNI
jgi:hypothetical protein